MPCDLCISLSTNLNELWIKYKSLLKGVLHIANKRLKRSKKSKKAITIYYTENFVSSEAGCAVPDAELMDSGI